GLPAGSTLFLDHDGEAADATPLGYVDAWLSAVAAAGFKPGLRAAGAIAARFTGRDPTVALWVVGGANPAANPSTDPDFSPQPSPGQSSVADAVLWRHTAKEDAPELGGGGTADLAAFSFAADFSSATMANPLTAA